MAILETDNSRLPEVIEAAQAAIDAPIQELRSNKLAACAEIEAIGDAKEGIRLLRQEVVAHSHHLSHPEGVGTTGNIQ